MLKTYTLRMPQKLSHCGLVQLVLFSVKYAFFKTKEYVQLIFCILLVLAVRCDRRAMVGDISRFTYVSF